jgi:Holliday junction resolvasome RuvABC endonuclease subunit
MARRLERIYRELAKVIQAHLPEQVAIEDVFYAVNAKSALKLGQVRGVAMLAAASAGLDWQSPRNPRMRRMRWRSRFVICTRRPRGNGNK